MTKMVSLLSQSRVWSVFLFALLLTACSSSTATPSTTTSPSTKSTMVQATPAQRMTPIPQPISYSCQLQQTPTVVGSMGPEIHGKASNSDLWALVMAISVPPRANDDVKIVWRMTGTGTFSLVALGPQGEHLSPNVGPEPHGGSNWNRPGSEWGSVFKFSEAGCWDIHAGRDGASGDVWLNISA